MTQTAAPTKTEPKPVESSDGLVGKAKQPRKHHYVPVFYQKSFANAEGLLWVYDRKLKTYKELPPKVLCFEEDLYAVKPEAAPRDRRVESEYLSRIDSLGASAIRRLQVEKRLTPSSLGAISLFVAHQFTRLPSTGRAVCAVYARTATESVRIMFANVERAKEVMERYAQKTGTPLDASPESMVEFVQGNHMTVSATETAFLANMVDQAATLSQLIAHFEWQILVAPRGTGFFICDSPVVVAPPKGVFDVGFGVPGTVKYFPLTRSLCLRLGDIGDGFAYRNVDGETVRIVNQNIAGNSERFIMGPVRAQLESVVARSSSTELDSTPRFIVEMVEQDENGSLLKFRFLPRRYFYPKDGSSQAP